jgi:hypothetical protein
VLRQHFQFHNQVQGIDCSTLQMRKPMCTEVEGPARVPKPVECWGWTPAAVHSFPTCKWDSVSPRLSQESQRGKQEVFVGVWAACLAGRGDGWSYAPNWLFQCA